MKLKCKIKYRIKSESVKSMTFEVTFGFLKWLWKISEVFSWIFLKVFYSSLFPFRTALMLGCEYGCKDAVEVLIKNGADVSLLDALGHDSSYYARIGDNLDILTLLKTASESANKGTAVFCN